MAGKKVEAAEIIIKTTDGGSFKIFGQKAKKAKDAVEGLGGAAQTTDRRIKGVTQQSSNATKNFSKQAQTMQGGIVAVYATIAAQVFAVSAAFQFLKSSMETRNLIEGQKAFGSVTGVAYKTLTKDLQSATQGMLDFKAAASSVAIGTASGLSAGQMTKLGVAAKNASMALGRDLTDSFNRLVRGVTKAEPELLDELGIVLRLENATRNYAAEVGKTREDLNAFERTQAVLNDVLEQAEQKFGRITELMDPNAFALGQLTKEIDDLVLKFQELLIQGLLPMITFFKDNAAALVAAIGLFVTPIIKSLLPDLDASILKSSKAQRTALDNMGASYRAASQEAKTAFAGMRKITEADINESAAGFESLGIKGKGDAIMEAKRNKDGSLSKRGGQVDTGYKQLNRRQVAAYRRAISEQKGIYMKMTTENQARFKRYLAIQEAQLNKSQKVQIGIVKRGQMAKDAIVRAGVTVFAGAEAAKLQIAKAGAIAMNAVMSIAGVLGVVAMVIAGAKAIFDYFAKADKAAMKLKKETEEVTSRLKDINEEMERMTKVRAEGLLGLVDGISQTGKALQSADVSKLVENYTQELEKSGKTAKEFAKTDLGQMFQEQAFYIEQLAPDMKGFSSDLMTGAKSGKMFKQTAVDIIDGAQALQRFGENTKSVNKQIEATIGRMAKLPFQDLMKPLQSSIDDFALSMVRMISRIEEMKGMIAEAKSLSSEFGKDIFSQRTVSASSGAPGPGMSYQVTDLDQAALEKSRNKLIGSGALGRYSQDAMGMKNMSQQLGLEIGEDYLDGITEVDFDQDRSMTDILDDLLAIEGNADKIGAKFGVSTDELETMNKALKEAKASMKLMELTNATNIVLLEKMKNIQKDSLGLEETKIQNAQTLAEAGVGSNKGVAMAKAQFKVDQAKQKKTKADIDLRIAGANKELEVNRLLDKLQVDEVITAQERLDIAGNAQALEDLALLKAGENYKTQVLAVENGKKAVENKDAEVTLNEELVKNSGDQLILDTAKINIQFQKLAAIEEEIRLQGLLNNITRGLKTSDKFGFAAAKEKFGAKGDTITAKQNINTDKLGTNLENINANASTAGFKDGDDIGVAIGGLDKKADDYQEALKFLQARAALLETEKNLTAEMTAYKAEAAKYITDEMGAANEILQFKRDQVFTLNPAEKIFQEQRLAHIKQFGDDTDFNKEKVAALAVEQANLNIEMELMDGIQSTLENGFVSMFQSLVDGTKSFKESMKDLAKNVLADLAAMFAKAAALKMMMAFMPGGSSVMSFLQGKRYGGQTTPGGKGYASGGIADGPNSGYLATLHGREAVVPLGNDRSIPVEMRGGGGGGNTVNVSISMNGQGQGSSQVSGDGMQGLGRSIGNMVQQHLQQEMRPGGLLNQQGTKGRA